MFGLYLKIIQSWAKSRIIFHVTRQWLLNENHLLRLLANINNHSLTPSKKPPSLITFRHTVQNAKWSQKSNFSNCRIKVCFTYYKLQLVIFLKQTSSWSMIIFESVIPIINHCVRLVLLHSGLPKKALNRLANFEFCTVNQIINPVINLWCSFTSKRLNYLFWKLKSAESNFSWVIEFLKFK